jgi:hypothetical protein
MAHNKKSWHIVALAFGLIVLLRIAVSSATVFAQADANAGVVPVDQTTFGKTYAQLSAAWWQWVLGIPQATNPQLDTTGEFCEVNQPASPFWFLAGTFGGDAARSCTIPAGKLLFFPVINVVTFDPSKGETVDDLRRQAAAFTSDVQKLTASIDGTSLTDLFGYRVASPVFSFQVPAGGLLRPGKHSPAVSDGYWLLLRSLSPGIHEIRFGGRASGATSGKFSVDVTYTLNVLPN